MKEKKLPFFAEVIIESIKPALQAINGKTGYVLGFSEFNDTYRYSVLIKEDCVWSIQHEDLKPTGVVKQRSDFYDGDSIRVQVTEDGEGKIIED